MIRLLQMLLVVCGYRNFSNLVCDCTSKNERCRILIHPMNLTYPSKRISVSSIQLLSHVLRMQG